MAKVSINLATGSIQKEELIVGIDLGTTNSLVAFINPDNDPQVINDTGKGVLVPSVVHFGPAGDITVGTIFNIMPFDNTVCTTTMTGAQLKFIFEQAVQTNGKGIQISGVKFTYDSTKSSYASAVLNTD